MNLFSYNEKNPVVNCCSVSQLMLERPHPCLSHPLFPNKITMFSPQSLHQQQKCKMADDSS